MYNIKKFNYHLLRVVWFKANKFCQDLVIPRNNGTDFR